MKIFDTHAHYDDERYRGDLDNVIQDNYENGVNIIVNASYDLESSLKSKQLADKYDNIYFSVGIHPEAVRENIQEDIDQIEKILKKNIDNSKLVAVGEIGLDYYYTKENKELQKEYFKKQLDLAITYNLPVIIHSRDASEDVYHILKDKKYENIKIVFHCFQPSNEIARLIIERKYMIGLGGNITFKRSQHSLDIIKSIPLDQIMVETDAPYMAPIPVRGTRNESKNIKYVIEKLAEIKEIEIEKLDEILYENSINFFDIKENS